MTKEKHYVCSDDYTSFALVVNDRPICVAFNDHMGRLYKKPLQHFIPPLDTLDEEEKQHIKEFIRNKCNAVIIEQRFLNKYLRDIRKKQKRKQKT